MTFVCYDRCSTCRKAQEWLDAHKIAYEKRPIKENNPSSEELKHWHTLSGLPLRRFFNTSGTLYKDMALKDRIPDMTEDEQYELLSSDGMLVKRPLLVGPDFVLVGFKEDEWSKKLL